MAVRAVPTRDELIAHLVAVRLAGFVATPRANSLDHARRLAQGDPHYLLGLDLAGRWSFEQVVEVLAHRCGVPAGGWESAGGDDYIDPDRTVAAIERMAGQLRQAVAERRLVAVATGHPGGLLGTHLAIAAGLAAAGTNPLAVPPGLAIGDTDLRQLGGVIVMQAGGALRHTHAPGGMELLLATLAAMGQPAPELVIADHGWAGAAGQHGIDTACFADCNDPALFVAEKEGTVRVTVPLDDNLPYISYQPLNRYLPAEAGLPDVGPL